MLLDSVVYGSNVRVTDEAIYSKYEYDSTDIVEKSMSEVNQDNLTCPGKCQAKDDKCYMLKPMKTTYEFKTDRKVPKLGVMLVGWGGNNGTTVTAGVLSNKHNITWKTKRGEMKPNYFGSLTQASTVRVGNFNGKEAYMPFNKLIPMVDPNDIVLGGWDISDFTMDKAMERACVLDIDLQNRVAPLMKDMKPLPAIFDINFVAENQMERATNVLPDTMSKMEKMEKIRKDLRDFKKNNAVDKIVVLWTANTERYSDVGDFNATKENLMASIKANHAEVSPSTLYAVACIMEGVPFINGAPQNTFVPGCTELAIEHKSMIGGDDFKSGQTKMKSVLTDFLISAGIKPTAIVSYNHLGNNDGKNLTNPKCFRSKEISKSDVVNDMISSNSILYEKDEHPDHCVVIKYIPYVGDSKRAMDEYTSEIFMGGINTIVMHNTCEDSLLAAPLILDLVLLAEVTGRISMRKKRSVSDNDSEATRVSPEDVNADIMSSESESSLVSDCKSQFQPLHPINVLLSYLTKAPFVPKGTPCINALNRQRAMVENIFKACVGLPPDNNMMLEFKC